MLKPGSKEIPNVFKCNLVCSLFLETSAGVLNFDSIYIVTFNNKPISFPFLDISFGGPDEKDEAKWFEYLSDLLLQKKFDPLSDTVSMMDFEELIHRKPKSNLDCRMFQPLKTVTTAAQPPQQTTATAKPTTSTFRKLTKPLKKLRTQLRKLFCWNKSN